MAGHRVATGEIVVHGLLLLLLLVCLFPAVFLHGEISLPGGGLLQISPWNQYQQAPPPENWVTQETLLQGALWYRMTTEMLEDGEWPLWNPLQLGGMPLLANSQNAVLYPPRLIHLVTDPYVGTTIYILLKLWLCGFTAYLLGRGIGLSVGPAQFLSVGWMLCAYNQHWAYWPPPDVSPWAPLVFLGAEWILGGRYRKGFFTVSLGATLLLLAGHPETAFGQGLGIGIYFVLRLFVLWRKRAWPLRHVAVAGAAWGMALLASAAAVLPLLEYLPLSEQFRSRPGEALAVEFAPALSYISFWIPRFFGALPDYNYWGETSANFVNTLYVGMATWVGMSLLLTRRSSQTLRTRSICLAIAVVFSGAMAFPLPFMRWIQELPILDSMWRFYYLPFALLGVLVLGATGIQAWFNGRKDVRELQWPALFMALIFLVVLATAYFQLAELLTNEVFGYVLIQMGIAAGLVLLSFVLLALATKNARVRRAAPYALVLILAVDLLYAARDLRPTCPREQLFFDTALTDYLRELPQPARVRVGPSGIQPGLLQHYGIEQWNGYDGIMPYRSRVFFTRTYASGAWRRIHRIVGIDYYLFPENIEEHPELYDRLERVGIRDGIVVMRDPEALPRAFLVGALRPAPNQKALLRAMAEPEFDPLREVVTESPPTPPWPNNSGK
ncbi:MAG: hypothetical protein U9Q79_07780, partial [Candidatus Hydrogenedentes bacterium]|nr:hypothetical protein [Candidatus Hydrogenedentota bacterium]